MQKDYYLGLDIGTDSVGWAVTDTDYNILKFKGNAMWGSHMTETADTAVERRLFRGQRRRLQRTRQRLDLLESLFSEEICKIDPSFFIRLKESDLYSEDKSTGEKYAVFADKNYTDKDFHKQYKTIYHLRSELINNEEPHDIRLVYLALHHIIKHRGHFLFDSDFSKMPDSASVFEELSSYLSDNYEISFDCSPDTGEKFIGVLKDKTLGKSKKAEALFALLGVNKKTDKQAAAVLKSLCGSKVKLGEIFDDEDLPDKSVCFLEGFDENAADFEALLEERFELLEKLKAVYDFALLDAILNGKAYISEAKVEVYEKHSKDLKRLKEYVNKYLPEKKYDIFKDPITKVKDKEKNNYVAYSGHCKKNKKNVPIVKRCSCEAFNKYLKKTLGECRDEAYRDMFGEIEEGTFLQKQVSKDNSVIPMQLGRKELQKILENACKYLPLLNETDENGISVADKVLSIFNYRVPYYIGPLNPHAESFWMIRKDGKENEKIYPWNFNSVIDTEASAEGFINNLTNKCTYLKTCDVIPKNSLLYSKFCVLNELNNLKIDGKKPSVETKQGIFNELFTKGKKVTKKALENYLKSQGKEFETLSGFDGDFKSTLKSFSDFKRYENLTFDEKEAAISAITIFGDDKKLLKSRLKKLLSNKLSDKEIDAIANLKYTGWGNLSKEFLTEVIACKKDSGECVNIITAMWETNLNLNELLYSKDFCCDGDENKTFERKISEENGFKENITVKEAVEGLYVSPKVKRPIYRALLITKEIEKIMKHPPKKIFIEVAKGADGSGRKLSRKSQLLEEYEPYKETYRELYNSLNEHSDEDLRSDKLYLYYTQLGQCMYTGRRIDLEELMSGKSDFDIDHVYPRSKIKDDSISNRVLVYRPANSKKSDEYPISREIRENRRAFWQELLAKKFISPEKYNRLTRSTALTYEELSAFVSRQLVETRQATKAVAHILEDFYKKDGTRIVYVKASLVSDFRHGSDDGKNKNGNERVQMLKCREVNDYHHAKDAYLNIVVGNVYDVKVTCNLKRFIEGLSQNGAGSYSLNRMFDYPVKGTWDTENNRSMNIVKNTMAKNNIRYTRYSRKGTGQLFNATIQKKGGGQVPQKADGPKSDISKYGGFASASTAYFSLVKYREKNKDVLRLVPVDVYREKEYLENPEKYVSEYELVKTNAQVVIPCVKIGACLSFDGFRMTLTGKSDKGAYVTVNPRTQLVLPYEDEVYIKKVFKYNNKVLEVKKRSADCDYEATAFDGIFPEKSIRLYDAILYKLKNTVYSPHFENVQKIMETGRNEFINKLKPGEQCYVLGELIDYLHGASTTADLRMLGGKENSGKLRFNTKISEIKNVEKITLINQSVTGLFEQEITLVEHEKESKEKQLSLF